MGTQGTGQQSFHQIKIVIREPQAFHGRDTQQFDQFTHAEILVRHRRDVVDKRRDAPGRFGQRAVATHNVRESVALDVRREAGFIEMVDQPLEYRWIERPLFLRRTDSWKNPVEPLYHHPIPSCSISGRIPIGPISPPDLAKSNDRWIRSPS